MNFHAADLNDIEALLREYDNLVYRATTDNMLGLVDVSYTTLLRTTQQHIQYCFKLKMALFFNSSVV